jgi:hypothetical protein
MAESSLYRWMNFFILPSDGQFHVYYFEMEGAMFYLWFGVIAGVLLAYAAMRIGHQRPSTGFLWLAAAAVLMLFIPVMLEFIKVEPFDELHLLEAMRTVAVPWFAGVGLGIWIYLATIPLRRLLRNLGPRMRGPVSPETQAVRQQYGREVHYKIVNSQRYRYDPEERLLDQKAVHPKDERLVKPSNATAKASKENWLSSTAEPDFNYVRPYGTLLAAMLLHAADELDSAVRDVELLSSTSEGSCPDDLTMRFKRAMLATLQISNTVAYFLSQNIEFADKRKIRRMEGREDCLAQMVDARRAADSNVGGAPIDATT